MTLNTWSVEGKLNIDAGSPLLPYVRWLGKDCGSGIYAYKSQTQKGNRREFKLLIYKLGSSDSEHIIVHYNTRANPPVQVWHYKDANGTHIGSLEEIYVMLLNTVLK